MFIEYVSKLRRSFTDFVNKESCIKIFTNEIHSNR